MTDALLEKAMAAAGMYVYYIYTSYLYYISYSIRLL